MNSPARMLFVTLLLAAPDPLVAQRALTLEDYYRFESVSGSAISPDGSQVAFGRSWILEAENRRHSEIWLTTTDGEGAPVRLTSAAFSSSNPRWSPDGTLLSFSSARHRDDGEGQTSVWFLCMDQPQGEAFSIDGLDGTPIFSPDNQWIAFTRATPPEVSDAPDMRTDFEKQVEQRFDGLAYDWMGYRFDRRGYLGDPRDPSATPPSELYVIPRDGGDPRQITDIGVNVSGVAWNPRSSAFAFTADEYQRDEYSYERADVFIVDFDGNVTRLTDNWFHYSNPAWAPDGSALVVRGYEGLDKVIERKQDHGSPIDLFVIPASGGEPRNITSDWDLQPNAGVWSPDGRYVYFSAGTRGNVHLFRVSPVSGEVEQVTGGDRRLSSFSISKDFTRIAFRSTDPMDPGNIFTAAIDGSNERRLTESNTDLVAELDLGRVQRLEWASNDGTPIDGWLIEPRNYDPNRTYSLVLVIHGGPHGAFGPDFSFYRQLLSAQGYFVFYTNPRGSTGYGEDFKWAIWGGWGDLDYEDLMSGIDYVIERYPVDETRLGVTGRSYGGFMTNWIIGHTTRFSGAVSSASISNWVSDYGTADIPRTKESEFFGTPWQKESFELMMEHSPIIYAGNVTTPTLFLHGEIDHRVPIAEAEQMYVALKKMRVPAKFVRFPESYHGGWTPWRQMYAYYEELRWWGKYLEATSLTP